MKFLLFLFSCKKVFLFLNNHREQNKLFLDYAYLFQVDPFRNIQIVKRNLIKIKILHEVHPSKNNILAR